MTKGPELTRVGITGHMNLTSPTVDLVRDAIRDVLSQYVPGGLTGISCLAAGADTIFALVVAELGGRLEVVLPSPLYRERKIPLDQLATFDRLTTAAERVRVLPFAEPDRRAYEAANTTLLDSSEVLVAVWDGRTPADRGGTGAVVVAARERGLPVHIIWPEGARRT